jgi:2-polyprenyl-3-methyl-5-hydroxy-6-metoxy-1,4-benzoquinol methylase
VFLLEQRASELEWMDGPDFGLQETIDAFRFLVFVNRWFGGIQPLLRFFRRESQSWDRHETYRILDVGCGAGDVAVALARWGRRRGYHLQVDAIDKHTLTVDLARRRCRGYPEISVSHQDIFHPNSRKHDYVHASQFLHHFPDGRVVSVVNHLACMAGRKLVINDLVRAPLHYLSAWAFTLLASPVSRHDARLSIRKGFRIDELARLLVGGGRAGFSIEKHFFFRFLLIIDGCG